MIKEEIAKINKLLVKKYGLHIQKNPNPDPVDILIATIFKHCSYEYKNLSEGIEYKESTFLLLDNIE